MRSPRAVDMFAAMWQTADVTRETSSDLGPIVAEIEAALRDPSDSLWNAELEDAVVRLGELQAAETIPLLVRVCDATDGLTSLHDACGRALSMMGERGLDALLDAHFRSTNGDTRHTLNYAIAELRIRDERVFALLLEILEEDSDDGACLLAIYGDPAALPMLHDALDRFELGSRGDGPLADHAVIELAAAIERLGGVVSGPGLLKLGKVRGRGRSFTESIMAAFRDRPRALVERSPSPPRRKIGRNERCWCGSGKKYKCCHLRDDARA